MGIILVINISPAEPGEGLCFIFADSVDQDQVASEKPSDQYLPCVIQLVNS